MRLLLTLTMLLTFTAILPGCSRIRQLTRRDYASLQDPFALHDGNKHANSGSEDGLADANPGIARMTDPRNSGTQAQTVAQASQSSNSDNSSFEGVRVRGMGDVISSDSGPSMSDFVGKTAATRRNVKSRNGSPDMAGFSEFLGNQAKASGLTDTANALDEDFAQWAATQKEEWSQPPAAIAEKAAPFINPIKQVSQSDVATPFLPKSNTPTQKAVPAAYAHPSTRPAAAPIGAANPFAAIAAQAGPTSGSTRQDIPKPEFEAPPANGPVAGSDADWAATAPSKATSPDPFINPEPPARSGGVDSGFNFDTGWKPPGLEQP